MMRFGSTAKVLAKCKLKYYRISVCCMQGSMLEQIQVKVEQSNRISMMVSMTR